MINNGEDEELARRGAKMTSSRITSIEFQEAPPSITARYWGITTPHDTAHARHERRTSGTGSHRSGRVAYVTRSTRLVDGSARRLQYLAEVSMRFRFFSIVTIIDAIISLSSLTFIIRAFFIDICDAYIRYRLLKLHNIITGSVDGRRASTTIEAGGRSMPKSQ